MVTDSGTVIALNIDTHHSWCQKMDKHGSSITSNSGGADYAEHWSRTTQKGNKCHPGWPEQIQGRTVVKLDKDLKVIIAVVKLKAQNIQGSSAAT